MMLLEKKNQFKENGTDQLVKIRVLHLQAAGDGEEQKTTLRQASGGDA